MSRQVNHLDVVKGLSIMSLALFHSRFAGYFPEFTSSMRLFRVPLFFFVSGAFFSGFGAPFEDLKRRGQLLLKPYMVVITAAILMQSAEAHRVPFWLAAMAWGNPAGVHIMLTPTWFLPHLFLVTALAIVLMNMGYLKLGGTWRWVAMACLYFGGYLILAQYGSRGVRMKELLNSLQGWPVGLDFAPVSLAIFLAGYQMRSKVFQFRPNWAWCFVALLAYGCVLYGTTAHMDLNRRILRDPAFMVVGIGCGVYMTMCVAHWVLQWRVIANPIGTVGQCTLYVLLFHVPIQWGIDSIFRVSGVSSDLGLWSAMAAYAMSIFISTWLGIWVQRNKVPRMLFAPPVGENPTLASKQKVA